MTWLFLVSVDHISIAVICTSALCRETLGQVLYCHAVAIDGLCSLQVEFMKVVGVGRCCLINSQASHIINRPET